jgi:stage V sporulation protein SpoVS
LQVPQTVLRAISNSEQHTYKAVSTVAIAQGLQKDPSRVLLYVPFTKSRAFTAIVLPTSSRVLQRSAALGGASAAGSSIIPRLQVKRDTDAEALTKTLSFDLIKHGSVVLESSGAAATAHAAAALQAVRQQMLSRGYELGVVPRFEEQRVSSVLGMQQSIYCF